MADNKGASLPSPQRTRTRPRKNFRSGLRPSRHWRGPTPIEFLSDLMVKSVRHWLYRFVEILSAVGRATTYQPLAHHRANGFLRRNNVPRPTRTSLPKRRVPKRDYAEKTLLQLLPIVRVLSSKHPTHKFIQTLVPRKKLKRTFPT